MPISAVIAVLLGWLLKLFRNINMVLGKKEIANTECVCTFFRRFYWSVLKKITLILCVLNVQFNSPGFLLFHVISSMITMFFVISEELFCFTPLEQLS